MAHASTPLLLYAGHLLLTGAVLGLTPASSSLRLLALPLHLLLAYGLLSSDPPSGTPGFALWSILTRSSAFVVSDYITKALVAPWEPPRRDRIDDKTPDRLKLGLRAATAARGVNVPGLREAKNTPRADPARSRVALMARYAIKTAACYLLQDILTSQPEPDDKAALFGPDKIPLFRRIVAGDANMGEVLLRVPLTLMFWLQMYVLIEWIIGAAALVCLGLRVHSPKEWRPAFGSWARAYTLRGFWG